MNTLKKNQIIITALAIMIAVAGYLNFTDKTNLDEDKYVFNNKSGEFDVIPETGMLVPNDENVATGEVLKNPELEDMDAEESTETDENVDAQETVAQDGDSVAGEAVLVSSNAVESEYFINAKIDREQTRALSVEILLEVINNDSLGEEQKVQAAAEMMQLQERIEKEAAAESLLEAKGFEEVFVRMDEDSADVVVNVNQLTEADLAQISDVVSRKTGILPENIVISPLKTQK